MKGSFHSVIIITIFTFAGQLVLFISQIITASLFGASTDMDAFLAANTLPQYIISVFVGSLGFVFIPVFIEYKAKGIENKAYEIANSLLNNCLLALGIITIFGIAFARQILQITAPGLSETALEMGVKVAIITWPTIIATGAFSLLSSVYQAEKKFKWQATVPFIGAVANLVILLSLARWMGVLGLAIATTSGMVLQVALLFKIITSHGNYKFTLNWNERGVQKIFKLAFPLIFVAILTKFTPLVDRYLASELKTGSISHLNYAFKFAGVLSTLISIGGATVIFPKMASDAAKSDLNGLRNITSLGLRMMWIIVAPVITIGLSLSLPVIILVFHHGEFTMQDAVIVAAIFNFYLIALIGMCLGSITSKGFYALKDTKTLAIYGAAEALSYSFYTYYLTRWYGVLGIAAGFMIYYNVSLLWQLIILNKKLSGGRNLTIIKSYIRTFLAALSGGAGAFFITLIVSNLLFQLLAGALLGISTYLLALHLLKSPEITIIKNLFPSKKLS
jgi:putative peptidoglycan lipid II flippase